MKPTRIVNTVKRGSFVYKQWSISDTHVRDIVISERIANDVRVERLVAGARVKHRPIPWRSVRSTKNSVHALLASPFHFQNQLRIHFFPIMGFRKKLSGVAKHDVQAWWWAFYPSLCAITVLATQINNPVQCFIRSSHGQGYLDVYGLKSRWGAVFHINQEARRGR